MALMGSTYLRSLNFINRWGLVCKIDIWSNTLVVPLVTVITTDGTSCNTRQITNTPYLTVFTVFHVKLFTRWSNKIKPGSIPHGLFNCIVTDSYYSSLLVFSIHVSRQLKFSNCTERRQLKSIRTFPQTSHELLSIIVRIVQGDKFFIVILMHWRDVREFYT